MGSALWKVSSMANEIDILDGGKAVSMGDDTFVLMQNDQERGRQSVVLTREDLERLLAA